MLGGRWPAAAPGPQHGRWGAAGRRWRGPALPSPLSGGHPRGGGATGGAEGGPGRGPRDAYIVRRRAPWDGPVGVVEVAGCSFRFMTLTGHLEAGQIRFRAEGEDGRIRFEIESWARSGDRLSNLLYDRMRMSKEIQLHMWISFLERVIGLAGGKGWGGL